MEQKKLKDTLALLKKRRPALAPALSGFEGLLLARLQAALELAQAMNGARLPDFDKKKAAKGEILLESALPEGMGKYLRLAAEKLLPELFKLSAIATYRNELENVFLKEADSLGIALLKATLKPEGDLREIAAQANMPPEILRFAGGFVISAVLRALVAREREFKWDEEGAWQEGYCPVCGSWPIIAWLDKRVHDEKNAFLAGGGGKKHLHCGICGASWKFRRGVCPACGKEGEGAVEILHEAGNRGERLDYCKGCLTYCPTVDLRELADVPDMDAMALGLLHLDLVARERKLTPLAASFWNSFQA